MAAKEFRDEQMGKESERYERAKDELFYNITNDDDYSFEVDGQRYLTEDGQNLLQQRLSSLQKDYSKAIEQVENEATLLAKRTFSLNLPILTASNIIMFGRIASGGFNTQANAKLKFRGGKYSANVPKLAGAAKAIGNAE